MSDLILIGDITVDQEIQSRAEIKKDTVIEYAALLDDDKTFNFEPVIVFEVTEDGETILLLADGFQRIEAYKHAGRRLIPAEIRKGTRREATFQAIVANTKHGVRPTNEDKNKMVTRLLLDDEWRTWTDNYIAKTLSVTQPFVSNVRKRLEEEGTIPVTEQRKAVRRGKVYEIRPDTEPKNIKGAPSKQPVVEPEIEKIELEKVEQFDLPTIPKVEITDEYLAEIESATKPGKWELGDHLLYINDLSKLKSSIKDYYYCIFCCDIDKLKSIDAWILDRTDSLSLLLNQGDDLIRFTELELDTQYATLIGIDKNPHVLLHYGIINQTVDNFWVSNSALFFRELLTQLTEPEDRVLIAYPPDVVIAQLAPLNRYLTVIHDDLDLAKEELIQWQKYYGEESPVNRIK